VNEFILHNDQFLEVIDWYSQTMRLLLASLEVFNAIATNGSLKAAAAQLSIKPSSVSQQLKVLEAQLDCALFIRTTRRVELTDAGRALFDGSGPAFVQLQEALDRARSAGHTARGHLKLAMPELAIHLHCAEALAAFHERFPEIEIELSLTDALEDIVVDGFHAGVRFGPMVALDMVALRLREDMQMATLASPCYLARQGTPEVPHDLLLHQCLRYRFHSSEQLAKWSYQEAGT